MHTHSLTALVSDEPPTEFRLFKAGVNATTKGDFIFDAEAAKAVMAAYEQQGVDLMIDLEHMSLRPPEKSPREDSADARGWGRLELRNGELWAVGVTWTPDGAARLRDKRQRYTSPAFLTDEQNRIVEILNVALVARPATHEAPALVAASRSEESRKGLLLTLMLASLVAGSYVGKGRVLRRRELNESREGQKGTRRHQKR